MSKKVESQQEVAQVATISANNDKEIGELIAKAMERVGKDGQSLSKKPKALKQLLMLSKGLTSIAATSQPIL